MAEKAKKRRLDVLLTERGLCESREKAKAIIMSGCVFVDGRRSDKPGAATPPEADIELRGERPRFVSRGGFKLEKALSEFGVEPLGLVCLDCGASTGGFTDVLLKAGARRVYAVDVGYGQLAWSLRSDERVVVLERTNIRYVTGELIPERLDLCTIDVSFISLKLVLPALKPLLKDGGRVVCLIKPQFEAGRGKVGKKGVVRDEAVHLEVLRDFLENARAAGFTPLALSFSPICGPEGNIEYLGSLVSGAAEEAALDPAAVVEASHMALGKEKAL